MDQKQRFALEAIQPQVNMTELCRRYGISKPTGYKWKERFIEQGGYGLLEHSRKPKHCPNELSEQSVCQIIKLKNAHEHWGPPKIHALYAKQYHQSPSLSSVKRVLEKAGYVKKRVRKAQSHTGALVGQIQSQNPNDIWTVDFKGWWRVLDGQRCEPLTVCDHNSRYILECRALESASIDCVRACFEQLFVRCGLPKCIHSDNGTPFASTRSLMTLSKLSAWWLALGINLQRSRVGKPQDNGAHERMHLNIKRELQSCAKGTLTEQQNALDIWTKSFNEQRPHEALAMKTPSQIYHRSERKYAAPKMDLNYPGMITRKVHKMGYFALNNSRFQLSTALAGWSVGIKSVADNILEVYFAQLLLGQINLQTQAFLRADIGSKEGSSKRKIS